MSTITRNNYPNLLIEMLHTVFFDYHEFPDDWKKIYTILQTDKAVEYEMEMQLLGLGSQVGEGVQLPTSTIRQLNQTAYVVNKWGLAMDITREAMDDNLYQDQLAPTTKQMRIGLDEVKRINTMEPFNNGFDGNYPMGDGKALFSTDHPTSVGTYSNTFTVPVGFNEASLSDAVTMAQSMKNSSGIALNLSPETLLVPINMRWSAEKVIKSAKEPGTPNNAMNPMYNIFNKGVISSPFLTNPYNWFLITNEANGFKFYQREKVKFAQMSDVKTDILTIRAIERYALGCSNSRAAIGVRGV